MMKAIVRDSYGPPSVLRLEEIDRPVPRDGEVLLRVRASSVNRADRYFMEGVPAIVRLACGLSRPGRRGLGQDFAGDVEAVGSNVSDFKPGDAVFGHVDNGEMWAEYACVPASQAAPKPANLAYEEAAALPLAGLTALQGLRNQGRVEAGKRVLINGATGGVGMFAVQIAKALGAEVTGVCSARNADFVRSLGADHVIEYDSEDFTASGRRFEVLFDVAGNRPFAACCKVLEPRGTYVLVGGPQGRWLGVASSLMAVMAQVAFASQRVKMCTETANRADLLELARLVEEGRLVSAIHCQFALCDAAEAIEFVDRERPPSKLVIAVSGPGSEGALP